MIAESITVQIVCDSCMKSEHKRLSNETKDSFLKTRIIQLSDKQINDKEYLMNILFDRELGLKMQPPIITERTIDMNWVMSKENKLPNDLFF